MNTSQEKYDLKRAHFIEKTRQYFHFLTSEFDFEEPNYTFSGQTNGTIISDQFEFSQTSQKIRIIISNDYHPVDYGFEINLIDSNSGKEEMVHQVLKEKQDLEQNYLLQASEYLRSRMGELLAL